MSAEQSTRRGFLRQAAVAGAAAGLASRMTASSYARTIGANERINIGMIGCGGRGSYIMANMVKPTDAANLVAVCDIWRSRLEKYPSEVEKDGGKRPKTYVDYRKLLEDADIDAVVIATPDHQHIGMAADAIKAGKHVYVEKPIIGRACDLDDLNKLVEVVKGSKMVLQNGTHGVSCPAVRAVKQFLAEKKLGKLFRIETTIHYEIPYWVNYRGPATPDDTDWKAFLYGRKERPFDAHMHACWMGYWELTSGTIGGWMTHFSNFVHFVTGCDYPTTAAAWGGRYAPKDDPRCTAPNQTMVILEYPEGFHTQFVSRFGNSIGNEDTIFYFEQGVLRTRFGHWIGNPVYSSEGLNDKIPATKLLDSDPPYPGKAHLENWFKCIREGGVPNANIDFGHKQGVVTAMGDVACTEGRKVTYDKAKRQVKIAS